MKLFKIIVQHVNHKSRVQTRFSGPFLEKLHSAVDSCVPVLTFSRVCVCVCVYVCVHWVVQSWPTLCNPMDYSLPGFYPWGSPSKNTGMGCHFLLQGIFSTQGSNASLLYLLHWQVDSFPWSFLPTPFFPPYIYKNMVLFLFFSLIMIMDSRIFPPLNVLEFP